jgi:hypothetical protein
MVCGYDHDRGMALRKTVEAAGVRAEAAERYRTLGRLPAIFSFLQREIHRAATARLALCGFAGKGRATQ